MPIDGSDEISSGSSGLIERVRYVTAEETVSDRDDSLERKSSVRPKYFTDYPGQSQAKENLRISVGAAKSRGEPLDHVILHGPPGLGKTTLANIVANELDLPFFQSSGPVLDKVGDLVGILTGLTGPSVVFIDEIHRLPISVEETLYAAMEDFSIDVVVGKAVTARTVKLPVSPFTLVGATTRLSLLSSPMRSRFGIQERLFFYDQTSLTDIIKRSADFWEIRITDRGARSLASRSRGTPRIANRLLRRVRDYADFTEQTCVDDEVVQHALYRLDIDEKGLDKMDRKIIQVIRDSYDGGPVGVEALAATLGEDRSTLEEVYEPYLIHLGFLKRGPRGRQLTKSGSMHLASVIK